jgi:hypothetical protein
MPLKFEENDQVKVVLGTHEGKGGIVRHRMRTELGRRYYTVLLDDASVTVFGEQELELVQRHSSEPTDDPIRAAIDRAFTSWARSLDTSSVD